jgi:regulator of replication initiation timing
MELKVENNELRKENKKLRQEIERLKKENKKQVTSTHSTKKAKGNRLPTPPMKDLDEDDIFGDMLENIGGLYDDEE